MSKKSVFISYAHRDGMDFTRRLSFSLSMYMDVFWDRRLQAGDFPSQLENEIENRDYLLFIMTPYSIASKWCQRELAHAEKHNKKIAVVRVYSGDGTTDDKLTTKYTYGDFTQDFDAGFRHLTSLMLAQPLTSWEFFPSLRDKDLLDGLQRGLLPTTVSLRIAEWVFVDILWDYIDRNYLTEFESRRKIRVLRGRPRTLLGILKVCGDVLDETINHRDSQMSQTLALISRTVNSFREDINKLTDDDMQKAGEIAFNILTNVASVLRSNEIARRDAHAVHYVDKYFYFDVAEQLREIINQYARRSRYLY